jgi:NADPH-dependent curcumin reductase CurA
MLPSPTKSKLKSYARPIGFGEVMSGESVAEVIASDHPGYAEGGIVLARTGWRTHCASYGILPLSPRDWAFWECLASRLMRTSRSSPIFCKIPCYFLGW